MYVNISLTFSLHHTVEPKVLRIRNFHLVRNNFSDFLGGHAGIEWENFAHNAAGQVVWDENFEAIVPTIAAIVAQAADAAGETAARAKAGGEGHVGCLSSSLK